MRVFDPWCLQTIIKEKSHHRGAETQRSRPILEQWAHDLASQGWLERRVADLLGLLLWIVLTFCLLATRSWRTAPTVIDNQASQRWFRTLILGTLVDVLIFAIGVVLVWFGILYMVALDNLGVRDKTKFSFALYGAFASGQAFWLNVQQFRNGFSGRDV